jgi:hypothetical protein
MSELVTTRQMASILGVSVDTLRALGKGRRAIIRPIRAGTKRWLWHVASVQDAFAKASIPPSPKRG